MNLGHSAECRTYYPLDIKVTYIGIFVYLYSIDPTNIFDLYDLSVKQVDGRLAIQVR